MKVEWKNETGLGVWTGEDPKDLIWLMLYTGFRISDATLFNLKRLHVHWLMTPCDARSTSAAAPCPPPTHIVPTP